MNHVALIDLSTFFNPGPTACEEFTQPSVPPHPVTQSDSTSGIPFNSLFITPPSETWAAPEYSEKKQPEFDVCTFKYEQYQDFLPEFYVTLYPETVISQFNDSSNYLCFNQFNQLLLVRVYTDGPNMVSSNNFSSHRVLSSPKASG